MSKKAVLGEVAAPAVKDDKDYEAEDAMRTLMQAEEIKQNDKLMERVHKHVGKKKKAIKSIADLRKRKAEMDMEEDDDEES